MKKLSLISTLIIALILSSCGGSEKKQNSNAETTENKQKVETKAVFPTNANGKVQYLNTQNFVDYIFDFRREKEWNFKSNTPCVIDFYADWCMPCKMIAPIMEELALEYKGRVQFYKVDTDKEQELAQAFGIRSIPTIMVCQIGNKPAKTEGAMPKKNLIRIIDEIIFNKK